MSVLSTTSCRTILPLCTQGSTKLPSGRTHHLSVHLLQKHITLVYTREYQKLTHTKMTSPQWTHISTKYYILKKNTTLSVRCELKFRFPAFSSDFLVNSFPTWISNIVFYSHYQSQKLGTLFFYSLSQSQNLGTLFFLFQFQIPSFKKIYLEFYWEIK